MSVSVRPLEADDRARWEVLWNGYLQFYEQTLSEETTEGLWARLLNPDGSVDGFAAIDGDGQLIGITHFFLHPSSWTGGSYCYLEDLFVDPDRRGSGAGRALIDAVDREARRRGAYRLYLITNEDNATARALYDRLLEREPIVQYARELKPLSDEVAP
ncbi:MAG: GNAT family N-acetyltransferase [Pseudomonadota bacterium]